MIDKSEVNEELDSIPIEETEEETHSAVRGVTVRCGRCLERRFFCLSTPSKLNILTLICSGCGDILSTGVMVEKIPERKKSKREVKSTREDISYTG